MEPVVIVELGTAIRRCGVLLCEGLHLENPELLAALLEATVIDSGLSEVMFNGFTSRDYKWNQLFFHLLE